MKHLLPGLILITLTLSASLVVIWPHTLASAPPGGSAPAPVVVELFTSEGCSSCPPADILLARLAEQPSAENVHVIALEEHVDYWNEQGWADPFSSPDWTSRQYVYATALKNGNPYTPQMVVDGSSEFVGSHSQKAWQAILEAAGKAKTAVILAAETQNSEKKWSFSVTVGKLVGTTSGGVAEVWLAITETGLHSAVTRGENAGRELHHAAIVRTMRKIGEAKGEGETSFTGDARVSFEKSWKHENLRAVAFVQEKKSRRILGAAEIRIAP